MRMMPFRVCLAGTWDPAFSRNRATRHLLESAGCEISECHVDLWGRREDRIVREGKMKSVARALIAYPMLVWKFLRTPPVDIVFVPYPGHFDVPLLSLLCRLRRWPLIFDTFISLFDTIVLDRKLAPPRSPLGWMSRGADAAACRMATLCLTDTPAHATYFAKTSGRSVKDFRVLWVGAREDLFVPHPEIEPRKNLVVFYGSFIPLQGISTIIEAARLLESSGVAFRIIGDGQESPAIDALIGEYGVTNVERVGRVPLERLPLEIAAATICLGIFGTSDKAKRVVPHKLYEAVAVGRPVITGDTPAIRSAFEKDEVYRVPVGSPEDLATAIEYLINNAEIRETLAASGHAKFRSHYSEGALVKLLHSHLNATVERFIYQE